MRSRAERALRNAFRGGTLLDFGGEASRSSPRVPAELIAELLLAGPSSRPGRTAVIAAGWILATTVVAGAGRALRR